MKTKSLLIFLVTSFVIAATVLGVYLLHLAKIRQTSPIAEVDRTFAVGLSFFKERIPALKFSGAGEYLAEAVTPPQEVSQELEKTLRELDLQPIVIPDCLFIFTSSCLPQYQISKSEDGGLWLETSKVDSRPDGRAIYSLLWGDLPGMYAYEAIDETGGDQRLGIERMIGPAFEFNINPLIASTFLKMIDSAEYDFIKNISIIANKKLRAYYDYLSAPTAVSGSKIFKTFNKTEKIVVEKLKSRSYTAAEKAVIAFGVSYYDANFVSVFGREWQALVPLLGLEGRYRLTVDAEESETEANQRLFEKDFEGEKTPQLAYCDRSGRFNHCRYQEGRISCRVIEDLQRVCLREKAPVWEK